MAEVFFGALTGDDFRWAPVSAATSRAIRRAGELDRFFKPIERELHRKTILEY